MKEYRTLGMEIKLRRTEVGIPQRTLARLLGTGQRLVHLWESGKYMPGPRYLRRVNQFLMLDPLAVRIFVKLTGLQQGRKRGTKPKRSVGSLDHTQVSGGSDAYPSAVCPPKGSK